MITGQIQKSLLFYLIPQSVLEKSQIRIKSLSHLICANFNPCKLIFFTLKRQYILIPDLYLSYSSSNKCVASLYGFFDETFLCISCSSHSHSFELISIISFRFLVHSTIIGSPPKSVPDEVDNSPICNCTCTTRIRTRILSSVAIHIAPRWELFIYSGSQLGKIFESFHVINCNFGLIGLQSIELSSHHLHLSITLLHTLYNCKHQRYSTIFTLQCVLSLIEYQTQYKPTL